MLNDPLTIRYYNLSTSDYIKLIQTVNPDIILSVECTDSTCFIQFKICDALPIFFFNFRFVPGSGDVCINSMSTTVKNCVQIIINGTIAVRRTDEMITITPNLTCNASDMSLKLIKKVMQTINLRIDEFMTKLKNPLNSPK